MLLDDYQALAARTCNADGVTAQLLEWLGADRPHANVLGGTLNVKRAELLCAALGLAGEAGEVVDRIKKEAFHGHAHDEAALVAELGDVLWYVAYAATALGLPLSVIAARNVQKLAARYPNGFAVERSVNR